MRSPSCFFSPDRGEFPRPDISCGRNTLLAVSDTALISTTQRTEYKINKIGYMNNITNYNLIYHINIYHIIHIQSQ